MRRKIAAVSLVSMLIPFLGVRAAPAGMADLARQALSGTPAESADAVAALRQAGPAGMEAMLAACKDGSCGEALDRVCGVHDCPDIRLFWYTDLDAAKAAARATGKPILSLRLMGRLDEEFSCANSRFFRTVFYNNREINQILRDRYVLHWRSVRPVPKVTIDFGDGNRLEQTLTGNSIHYVLDSRGRLLEPLPGLYGPAAFRSALDRIEQAARTAARLDDAEFARWITARHQKQLYDRATAFDRALANLPPEPLPPAPPAPAPDPAIATVPAARDPWAVLQTAPGVLTDRLNVGGLETGSKSAGERSILQALLDVGDDQLRALAPLHRIRIHLDPASRDFLLRKQGITDPQEAKRLVDAFETTVALDEVINEYRTRPAILKALSDPKVQAGLELETFNRWVYEDVFRTPLSDPWLGLAPKDVYGALPASARTAAVPKP
ncbi:MAG: hypothetical protein ACJ76N_30960 [Thermoanaerobaculia bacterium]